MGLKIEKKEGRHSIGTCGNERQRKTYSQDVMKNKLIIRTVPEWRNGGKRGRSLKIGKMDSFLILIFTTQNNMKLNKYIIMDI